MVEMTECACILQEATSRSLILLDEVGRGTSTYDGISIAWAIAEYLLQQAGTPKTLFATHYFELTALEEDFPQVINYHAACQEHQDSIVLLHQIKEGKGDKSYGIHVAKKAGLPLSVISRAYELLHQLQKTTHKKQSLSKKNNTTQLSFL